MHMRRREDGWLMAGYWSAWFFVFVFLFICSVLVGIRYGEFIRGGARRDGWMDGWMDGYYVPQPGWEGCHGWWVGSRAGVFPGIRVLLERDIGIHGVLMMVL
jgi:hypothetical protein